MGVRLSIVCVTVNRTELPVHTGHLLGERVGWDGGYFCMGGRLGEGCFQCDGRVKLTCKPQQWKKITIVLSASLHYDREQDEQCKQGGGLVLESNNGKNLGGQMSDMVVQILNS